METRMHYRPYRREKDKKLYASTHDDVHKLDTFLGKNLLKLTQQEIKIDSLIFIKETESVT